jgi:hypothetical protein
LGAARPWSRPGLDARRVLFRNLALEGYTVAMAKLSVAGIRALARSIVAKAPEGIRLKALIDLVSQSHPETPTSTIRACTWNLDSLYPNEITKPSRGLFILTTKVGDEPVVIGKTEQVDPTGTKISETDFYQPFAEWLENDLDEVNSAVSLGGAGLKSKWGTPDVVGIYKPTAGNLIKFPMEIVSAEIKIDPQAPVVAFGQAVAYRLFSTKTYIAMPVTLSQADLGRLESLCMLFGVGLVLFELNKAVPAFSIRMRAQRFSPDMFYVNEFADRLRFSNAEIFETLFG